jgi:peptidyl-prolyl cis-trans isomerase A (cyclophilin A)
MLKKTLSVFVLSLFLSGVAAAAETGPAGKDPVVLMETSMGNVKIQLDPQKAPISVKNFLDYVNSGFYNGTIFHRVIPGFMIQGGGFTAELTQKKTNAPIKNEADNGLKNDRGTIAMARTGDPNSATAQFFINVVNNNALNRPSPDGFGYAVFGKVTEGMDVVDKITGVKTGISKGFRDVPEAAVLIKSMKVLK